MPIPRVSPNRCPRVGCKGRGRVVYVSQHPDRGETLRRRECEACRLRWNTVETAEIKKNTYTGIDNRGGRGFSVDE